MGREVIFIFIFYLQEELVFPILALTTAVWYPSGIAFPPSKAPELKSIKISANDVASAHTMGFAPVR